MAFNNMLGYASSMLGGGAARAAGRGLMGISSQVGLASLASGGAGTMASALSGMGRGMMRSPLLGNMGMGAAVGGVYGMFLGDSTIGGAFSGAMMGAGAYGAGRWGKSFARQRLAGVGMRRAAMGATSLVWSNSAGSARSAYRKASSAVGNIGAHLRSNMSY